MEHGECDLDHLLKLSTNPSKLEGSLQVLPLESVKGVSSEAFIAFLEGNGVLRGSIDHDAIERLVSEVIGAPLEPHERVVAQGEPAVHGDSVTYILDEDIQQKITEVNDRIEAAKSGITDQEIHDTPALSDDDEQDQAISHYDLMSFVIVNHGDTIAKKTDRSDGLDGNDIFGKVIPAHEGKANEGVLDASILVSSDGICTAAISGVLTADRTHISVSSELEVGGDVDFQTGRIVFPGSVVVKGSVRDRFSVRADGDITINGLVESADLESQKNIALSRGMAGKESGTINAQENLEAGYLEGVIAIVGGDVVVRGEITNCDLKVRGRLQAEHAAIRGGRVQISRGGAVGSVGSAQGVETELEIGSLPGVESELRAIHGFLEQLDMQIVSKSSTMETIAAAIAKPTPSQIEEQMGMQFEIDELVLRKSQLIRARQGLEQILHENTTTLLSIKKAIYAKVVLYIPGYRVEFPSELVGESVIQLGPTGHPSIAFRGKTVALSEHARVMTDDRVLRVIQENGAQDAAA